MWELRSALRRIRYDLARELTVGISAAVLMATFLYVFGDFLHVELASVSPTAKSIGAHIVFGCLSFWIFSHSWSAAFDGGDIRRFTLYLGASRRTAHAQRTMRAAGIMVMATAVVIALRHLFDATLVWVFLSTVIGGAGVGLWRTLRSQNPQTSSEEPQTPAWSLTSPWHWRTYQILSRNKSARIFFGGTLLVMGLNIYCATRGWPLAIAFLPAVSSGWLVGSIFMLQAEEDLRWGWFERSAGLSHQKFIGAYHIMARWSALFLVVWNLLTWGLIHSSATSVLDGLRLGLIAAVPVWLTPSLLLQIDARRPVLQIIMLLMVALFLGTALLASWASLLLPPIVSYYASNSQQGRYYRAHT